MVGGHAEHAGALRPEDREIPDVGHPVWRDVVPNMMRTKDGNLALALVDDQRLAGQEGVTLRVSVEEGLRTPVARRSGRQPSS